MMKLPDYWGSDNKPRFVFRQQHDIQLSWAEADWLEEDSNCVAMLNVGSWDFDDSVHAGRKLGTYFSSFSHNLDREEFLKGVVKWEERHGKRLGRNLVYIMSLRQARRTWASLAYYRCAIFPRRKLLMAAVEQAIRREMVERGIEKIMVA